MTKAVWRGADALVASMLSAGVRHVFTLSGNHIMPIFDALFDSGIGLVHTRHEAAAVHMADAYARLTGEPGIALVTGGPGHANAVSALYTAQMAESPVILLSGHARTDQIGMGAFQEMRQADLAAPLTKSSWTSADPDAVADDFARAVRVARSGRPGPVHLSLPTDVLEGDASPSRLVGLRLDIDSAPLSVDMANAMLERLDRALRPLILTGPLCLTKTGRRCTVALEEACGIPVIGMESPRGINDPSLGAFAGMLAQADCVLLLGKRMDFTLSFGGAPAFDRHCQFLQIDADSEEFDRSRRVLGSRLEAVAEADTFASIATLTGLAARPLANTRDDWRRKVRHAVAHRPASWAEASSTQPDRMHPVQALRPLQALLDSHVDSVLVCDGGEIGQWAQACLTAPNRVINGVAGAIGAALPFAVAARIAKPDVPVIAVMGDGTFGFHAAEIDTAVRYRLAFVAVIGNDARWNAEYQIQLRDYGAQRLVGCELLPTRYDLVVQGFGGHGEFVTDPGDVLASAQRAQTSGMPACLNLMIEGLAAPSLGRH